MLQNWLKPVPADLVKMARALPADSLGANLVLFKSAMPDLKKVQVALIGLSEDASDRLRVQLYSFAHAFPSKAVADLGNLRKQSGDFLIPLLYELLSGDIVPVLIGGDDSWGRFQFLSYQDRKALVNLAVIDSRCRTQMDSVYGPIIQTRHPLLFNFGVIGFQAHFTPSELVQQLSAQHFDLIRLGKTRGALDECEPVLRDADLLGFHVGALKQSEAPGASDASPSGLFWEEACQLCRYAGMSDKLSSFGIYGYNPDKDQHNQTSQGISQMIWYFLEGYFNRKGDYPVSTAGLTEYVVDFRRLNYQLTFWKSVKTGRWWMQVPVPTHSAHERHRLVPCSYQDYQMACREELPERLLQSLSRFS
ncbi:MAG: arginase family protein [Bacteroidetes bacterium]|nr:arginase family protein [Bacteroidota bacterium]